MSDFGEQLVTNSDMILIILMCFAVPVLALVEDRMDAYHRRKREEYQKTLEKGERDEQLKQGTDNRQTWS